MGSHAVWDPFSGAGGSRRALRAVAAAFAAGLIVAACASTAATPSSASPGSSKPWPAPTYAPRHPVPVGPWPSPSETPWLDEGEGPDWTPWPSIQPATFEMARGKAAMAKPAADHGAAAATGINDFGFDLLRRLDADANLCLSPTSIALALAMVRPGAVGTTASEMDAVLRRFGAAGEEAEIVALLIQLGRQTTYADEYGSPLDPGSTPLPAGNPNPLIELRVANQAFSQRGMTLEQAYLNALSSNFGAGVGLLDFASHSEAARLTINKWANYATRGRIPDILQPGDIDSTTRIALANAIYLNAPWQNPFPPENTKPRAFTPASGPSVNVPTMAITAQLGYVAGAGYRAVDLGLAWPSSLSMTVVVPDDMASLTASLTAAKLASLTGKMSTYEVDLALPRFSLNTRVELSGFLRSMGMATVFDPVLADLSGITKDEPLSLQSVVHQANIDVVEGGVEAAAVTIAIGTTGGPGDTAPHVDFHVDKPFLYFVRERESGVVLFMGRVNDPSPAG